MTDAPALRRWRPAPATLVAAVLVIVGFLLTGVSWWFLLLVAVGTLGPGLLRECGVLRDRDEFQRRADHRAGYHAFLVAGLVAFLLVAFIRAGGAVEHAERLVTLLLALLWFTWLFSSLLAYWGPVKTASRVLVAFGCVWLVFAVLSNVGSEWTGWAALLLHPLLAVPFFVLAWVARRWPRTAGGVLLAVAAGMFWLIEVPKIARDGVIGAVSDGIVPVFLLGPLLACGTALLVAGRGSANDDEDAEDG